MILERQLPAGRGGMAMLSLKISVPDNKVIKTIQFEPGTLVYDACRIIRDKVPDSALGDAKEYGLFLTDDDPKKSGCWLENGKALGYYLLKSGDTLEYRKKLRPLRVRMLDGSVKTVLVDDSQPIANLMVVICTKIGITNHDEFSLVRDLPDENKEPNTGTLTLRREKKDKDRDQKMEQLKKKLKTDDDLNWVDHSKTLRELGVDEDEMLTLRRKYFFSDSNVDSRDPVQLNLLYVQARDAILNTTHPVTLEEACKFAGLQCQIQFGDHNETKHKPGFLDLKEFLPKDYAKIKGIEKKIFAEHRKNIGTSELDAKVKYVALARSLKTYGVTFFLVKEKMKGKNKLVPRLLGVTKDSVMRLDERTKEIMKVWPLTTVRRWAASPNSFTLDFGDYSESYYSVQTTEGEQISQLIAGYIDIILKKKKAKDHLGIDGDEGSTMVEDSVSPAKATILQHTPAAKPSQPAVGSVALPAVVRPGTKGPQLGVKGHMPAPQQQLETGQAISAHSGATPAQQPHVRELQSEPQRALLGSLGAGRDAVQASLRELEVPQARPQLGSDPTSLQWRQSHLDTHRQNVSSQIAAMNAATAQVVTLTAGPPEEVDQPAVGAAITTIASNLPEMSKDVKMIAALMDDEDSGDKLLDAARRLCNAFSDLLRAAEPQNKEPRQNLLNAASRVGEASHAVLYTIGEEDEADTELQDQLLAAAKQVANATAALVLQAKNVASTCDDQGQQNRVIGAATQGALATSQLVACAKIVAPTITSPSCQEQLTEASKEVGKSVDAIVASCEDATHQEPLLSDLRAAAAQVSRALEELLLLIRGAPERRARATVAQDGALDTILDATDRLFSSTGDAPEMVRQAKVLARATAQLIQAIKGEAQAEPDSDQQKRLLAAAKVLADATARMIEAAKGCASNPHDSENQAALRKAAEELRNATNVAASNALKRKIIVRLENAARHASSAATQNIAAAQNAGPYNSNTMLQEELMSSCRDVAGVIPRVVQGIKGTVAEPDNPMAHHKLLTSCQELIPPASQMVSTSKGCVPTIVEPACATQLNNATKQTSSALSDLRIALDKAQETCGRQQQEIDSALDRIRELDQELVDIRRAALANQLRPLPGENSDLCALKLGATSKVVGSSMAQLLTAASQGNESYTGTAARDTASALQQLVEAVRGVVATSSESGAQATRLVEPARQVLDRSCQLLEEARQAVLRPDEPDKQQRLAHVAKSVSAALNACINCLPGQKDVDDVIRTITESSQALNARDFPTSNRSYGELQSNLNEAAAGLNEATGHVVQSSRGNPAQLASSVRHFGTAFGSLLGCGMEMAGQTQDQEVRSQMVVSLKNVSMVSSKLLVAAKSVAADPSAPNAKNQLAAAARNVTESINHLVDVCTSAAPGQKECDSAVRAIQMMRPMLDQPNEPVNDLTYYDCLDTVLERSRSLGDAMTGIANHAKRGEHEQFSESVREVSSTICTLVESSAQAAYLVGASDSSSMAGKPGLVDLSHFARASQAIQMACQQLSNPASSQPQILSAATVIAKHTSSLCNACRVASSKTTNPVAKRHFVQSAKDVASATASLVKEIKVLDQDPSDANRQRCGEATRPLIEAVDSLTTFASSPEFAGVPAKISHKARAAQEPITAAGRAIIDGSCSMILSAKSLVLNPKDPPAWQSLGAHSKEVSDGIKRLVSSIKNEAPGQKECDEAIDKLNAAIRELDRASLSILSQDTTHQADSSLLKTYQQQMESSASEILDVIEPLRYAAKGEPEKLGHTVNQAVGYLSPLVQNVIAGASHTLHSKRQMALLDQTKTVAEGMLQLVYASKQAAGNPKAVHVHGDVDEAADNARDALQELLRTLESAATEAGVVTGLVESVSKAMYRLEERSTITISGLRTSGSYGGGVVEPELSYVDYQTRMVRSAKEVARVAQDMVTHASHDPSRLTPLAADLSHHYAALAGDARGAMATSTSVEVPGRIRAGVQDLGKACISLTKSAGACQSSPGDIYTQRELAENARFVSEKVSHIMAALQAGSRGTQACINAASTVSGIIGDLDTTIMFATAGTLHSEKEGDQFVDHRENILKTAKALVEDTKTLVAGAASSQEQLAVAAQNAVSTIVQLAEAVKLGAASLGAHNPEAQVLLVNAVKDVAAALGDLVQATKAASGKGIDHPAMAHLKDSAKVMVTNVTSLLKTVRAVEDEHARGTRALESTVEAISQEVRAFDSSEPPLRQASPEDLVRATQPVTLATAKAVAAGNSGQQGDVIVAANMGRKAIFDLLSVTKSASCLAETQELKSRVLTSGRECAIRYRELLQLVLEVVHKPTVEGKQALVSTSRNIAAAVTDIVAAAEALKGTDWADPNDPTVIAETELLGAASSIEAAARKLANLQPRRSVKEADESLNFDEMILEAAKSITAATSALVRAASAAQRELVAAGKLGERLPCSSVDGQWSEGLVSAARLVAAATHSLVESANWLVQGQASEEKLISSAKQVASSTAQLLVACKVKAEPDSSSMRGLQAAGNAVKQATDHLVRAAQRSIAQEQEFRLVINQRMVGGIAQEIGAREEILRKERELEEARERLAQLRRAKYGSAGDGML